MTGGLHHVELWVPDLERAVESWEWLLTTLEWTRFQDWENGRSWRYGHTYLVVEQSPAMTSDRHDRRAPGLNHIAVRAESTHLVDQIARQAPAHGWSPLFADRFPYAGGREHYAAYLVDRDGFEAEIVASTD